MKAITELTNEHQGIRVMLAIMNSIASKLAKNEAVDINHLVEIVEFLSGFADKCHHGKEEGILFVVDKLKHNPVWLQQKDGILSDHAKGRALIASAKAVLSKEVVEAEGLKQLGSIFKSYAELLETHIETENTVLFPALDYDIDTELDERLFEAFEQLENEVIGIGKHEEYHAMLHNYKQIYNV